MRIDWQRSEYDPGFVAKIGNITLGASPDRTRFGKAARGTKWRASVTHWDAPTSTASRYGRDVYMQLCDTKQEAMRLAEVVYNEERSRIAQAAE